MNTTPTHQLWMEHALTLAKQAQSQGEVPIGAVIVQNEQIIGRGFNSAIALSDPTAHAEIMALREACLTTKNYRLPNTTLYVTLEPCIMCAGALIHARVDRIIFASNDSKVGVFSQGLLDRISHQLNHQFSVTAGICNEQAQTLIRDFFRYKRNVS